MRAMSNKSNLPHPDEFPSTVEEALEILEQILSEKDKQALSKMKVDDLIDLHFSLGVRLRNQFGLWYPNSKLMADLKTKVGNVHPDDASGEIIRMLWERLRQI